MPLSESLRQPFIAERRRSFHKGQVRRAGGLGSGHLRSPDNWGSAMSPFDDEILKRGIDPPVLAGVNKERDSHRAQAQEMSICPDWTIGG